MYLEDKINSKMIKEMTEEYEKLILLDGPAQYGVILSDDKSTTLHFHNYIEKYYELPKSDTKLEY